MKLHVVYNEVPVPSQDIEQSYICVSGLKIVSLSMIFLLDFGNIPTV